MACPKKRSYLNVGSPRWKMLPRNYGADGFFVVWKGRNFTIWISPTASLPECCGRMAAPRAMENCSTFVTILKWGNKCSVGPETSIPEIEKLKALRERPFLFLVLDCPILEKKSPLSEKEIRPWASLSQVYLFPALQNNYSGFLKFIVKHHIS